MHYLAYNEGKQHGTAEFPVAYYYVNEEHSSYNMPFHWHKEWEIIRILKGDFPLYIEGEEYLAKEGDILLLREGVLHGGTPENCIYECFNFDLHGLFTNVLSVRNFLRPFYRNKLLPTVSYPDRQPDIYPIVQELLSAFEHHASEGFCALTTMGNISRLFATILEKHYYTEADSATENTRKITQLKPVLEYIESHFSGPLSLAELSAVIGMNPKYFCRFFTSITQQTPMNYVNYYRIQQASNMLSNTDLSVTEIGLECGFNDTCHFVKTFKKYKGVTPKQYQKRNL